MTDIEKVARAIWDQQRNHWGHYRDMMPDLCEWEELTQSKQRELMREAQAAIAAMQPVPQEPVAWMCERDDGSRDLLLGCNGEYARNLLELGATETPLYAFPTPPAGGSDEQE